MRQDDQWSLGGSTIPQGQSTRSNFVPATNGAGEAIPPFSVMEISSVSASGVYSVVKPTADSLDSEKLLFNGPRPVASGDAFDAMFEADNLVKATGAPDTGDNIGTSSGAWTMAKDKTGFRCAGYNSAVGVARVRPFRVTPSSTVATYTDSAWSDTESDFVAPPPYLLGFTSPWFSLSDTIPITPGNRYIVGALNDSLVSNNPVFTFEHVSGATAVDNISIGITLRDSALNTESIDAAFGVVDIGNNIDLGSGGKISINIGLLDWVEVQTLAEISSFRFFCNSGNPSAGLSFKLSNANVGTHTFCVTDITGLF